NAFCGLKPVYKGSGFYIRCQRCTRQGKTTPRQLAAASSQRVYDAHFIQPVDALLSRHHLAAPKLLSIFAARVMASETRPPLFTETAKRHLFSRPNKVNRVYPDDNIGTTTVSATPAPPKLGPTPQQSRLLHGSFESEESAYQSGGSSPACEATAAEAAATRGGSTVDLDGGGATAAARAPAMDSSQQKRDSS
uniref:PIPK domain-containing protein n=1 Tax=Macrostomum lignano TaxID=282301 RepID=A0A1I8GZU2_9PLAT